MTFIVQCIKIRKSPPVRFERKGHGSITCCTLMKERDFNECYEVSEMGSGVVAVLDALAMANFDELVILSSYSDSHE